MISNQGYSTTELSKGDGLEKTALLNISKIYKDGAEVSLTAYTIEGNNYFKLRDIAKAFDFCVTWDDINSTIGIDTSKSYK